MNKSSNDFAKCLGESKNNQLTFEDFLACKKRVYIQYMEKHLDNEKNNLASFIERF